MKQLSAIVAIAENMVIGKNNTLIWHISDDLKRFKALTTGHTVVMGRNTWNSLPRKPLPGRTNIVLSTNTGFYAQGACVAHSVKDALAMLNSDEEAFVIGGAQIYSLLMPHFDKLYVTWIHKSFDGDSFFPNIDPDQFKTVSKSELLSDHQSGLSYHFEEYVRIV